MTTTSADQRRAFYDRIAESNLAPLWESLNQLITPSPRSRCAPAKWTYDEIRPFIEEAGEIITAKEAERRVLILENPAIPGEARITNTLYAGLQLVKPGEVAPCHRHTQSALRFIVDGDGAYTAVDGEKTLLRPGDFVITPSWTWHDHGNESDRPMVWLDGLDIPLIQYLELSFAEGGDADSQDLGKPLGYSMARFGDGLKPLGWEPKTKTSPIINYPYTRTRAALDQMHTAGDIDPCHGVKMQYVNPTTGDHVMPTMGVFMQLLPKGFATAPYRSTDGTIFCAVEGRGRVVIGDETFEWGPRDIFVVPSWVEYRMEADDEAVLFSYSDRPIQEKLALWRELRGD